MSCGVKGNSEGNSARVSIPSNVRKTIGNIKEITGQNHSEDEIYAMLKECSMDPNETTQRMLLLDTFHEVRRKRDKRKEKPAESKWKPGTQGRANRAGHGSYQPRRISHGYKWNTREVVQQHKVLNESKNTSIPSTPAPGSCFSSSGPVLLPSQDLPHRGAVGPIQREVRIGCTPVMPIADNSTEKSLLSSKNSASEVERSNLQPTPEKYFHGVGNDQDLEALQHGSSTIGVSTVSSRPSSNQSNRSQKVGPSKEWKSKSTNSNTGHGVSTVDPSEVSLVSVGDYYESQPTPLLAQKQEALELQRKLEESHISVGQNVIIPNHLHVPDIEKLRFCFGNFDSSFGDPNHNVVLGSDKGPLFSQSYDKIHDPIEEQQLSNQYDSATVEDTETKYSDQLQSALQEPENVPTNEVKVSSAAPHYSESNHGVAPGALQHPAAHTSSLTTQTGQPSPLASSKSQVRDARRHPSFMVPQSFDPASYSTQYYRTGMEIDGRISPFLSAGAVNKYNGNAALLPPHISQSVHEGGVPLLFSAGCPSPMVTQAVGVMQTSLPTQPPFPLFRQPTGVPLTHFPPNYMPYDPYFSPLYIPSPAVHQFLNNGAFPQQPMAGKAYPTPTGTTAKYSSQYKQGSKAGNSVPGPYGLSMANYVPNSAATTITSTSNEDLAAHQTDGSGVWFTPNRDISTFQASSFYNLPRDQLAFNTPHPGHGTFTGMFHPPAAAAPPVHPLYQQPQVVTTPADMVGATPSVYQQQQHAQLNWKNNY